MGEVGDQTEKREQHKTFSLMASDEQNNEWNLYA